MKSLFAGLYLDEDVSVVIAAMLRARGHVAMTTLEANRSAFSDREQLEFAAQNGMVLLTHNRADFEKLASEYLASTRHHAGIIIAVRRREGDIVRRLLTLLDQVTADEFQNQVFYV